LPELRSVSNVPVSVGVPEIKPVAADTDKPAGRPAAPKAVAVLLVRI
jgi:hypothetical protein